MSLAIVRYVDVFLGLALLVSLVCLVLGARRARLQEVLAFLILSSLVLAAYWAWWACLAYSRGETEASKEVSKQHHGGLYKCRFRFLVPFHWFLEQTLLGIF